MPHFSSPFKNRRFAIAGRFSAFTKPEIRAHLLRVDASVVDARGHWADNADVLIAGAHAGKALRQTQDADLDIWDEASFSRYLSQYDQSVADTYAGTSTTPSIDCFAGHQVTRMFGLPKRKVKRERLDGERYSYEVAMGRLENLLRLSGFESLRGLVIDGYQNTEAYDNSLLMLLADQAQRLPHLRALAFPRSCTIQAQPFLAAFPDLQNLLIGDQSGINLDLVRHSGLRQFSLLNVTKDHLLSCSMPQLEFLELGTNRGVYGDSRTYADIGKQTIIRCMQSKQFPRLKHLGLHYVYDVHEVVAEAFKESAGQVQSLSVHETTIDQHSDELLTALVDSPLAQQLTHLTLGHAVIHDVDHWRRLLNEKHFPQLESLHFQGGHVGEQVITEALDALDLDNAFPSPQSLAIGLSNYTVVSDEDAERLLALITPLRCVRSLNIDHHLINSPQILRQLHALPYPVSSWRNNALLDSYT